MPLPAGKLDVMVAFRRPVVSRDALNGSVTRFVDAGGTWAGKRDASDAERQAGREVASTLTSRFIVRTLELPAGFDPTWRLKAPPWRGAAPVEFDISGVKEAETAWGAPLARGEAVEITAVARSEAAG